WACNSSIDKFNPRTELWNGDLVGGTGASFTVSRGGSTTVSRGGSTGGGAGVSGLASAGSFKRRETKSSFFLLQKSPMCAVDYNHSRRGLHRHRLIYRRH